MFVDRVRIKVAGGRGGNGCVSFRREKFVPFGGPNGGDGGHGGSVILRTAPGEQSLVDLYYAPHVQAGRGQHGMGKDCHGRSGEDRIVAVPVGTMVYDAATGELLADLAVAAQEFVAGRGGTGGFGNTRFKSSTRQAPRIATPGQEGEERELVLELKTVADVGLVGYPNAGKSTLITAISDAHPKTAPYPFTTRHPVVGVVEFPDFQRLTVADIPGLIDGAHDNVGLGHEFLRHIERCRVLVYVVDTPGTEGRKPWDDLAALQRELELYKEGLSRRPALVAANKMDVEGAAENLRELRKRVSLPVVSISALEGRNTARLTRKLRELLAAKADAPAAAAGSEDDV